AGQVVTTLGIGGGREAARAHHAHAAQATFALVLVAIAVGVVEHLADDVGAVEGRIRDHAHGGGGVTGKRTVGEPVPDARVVHELALAHAGADRQQQGDRVFVAGTERDATPRQLAPVLHRLGRHVVDARRT